MSQVAPPRKDLHRSIALAIVLLLASSLTGYAVYRLAPPGRASNVGEAYLVCEAGPLAHCNLNIPLKVNLALNVTVTDKQGHVVGSVYEPHDLILNNFYNWLIIFLDNAQSSQNLQASLKTTSGSTANPFVWSFQGTTSFGNTCYGAAYNCQSSGQGGLIEVGTVSTAAARTDTNLGSAYQSYFYTSSSCQAASTDTVVITGSENANTGATITESGLFYQSSSGGSGATLTFMQAHDVFAGIVVSGGNTITVQYTWSLNSGGFNYNLCEYLAGLWTQPNGAQGQVRVPSNLMVFFDTAGRNVSWSQHCQGTAGSSGYASANSPEAPFVPLASSNPTLSPCANWGINDPSNAMKIAVGTGSSAFSPTTRSLTSFYASNFITNTNYDSAGNAYETGNVLLGTGATISEAAIYLTLPKACIGYSPTTNSGFGSCVTGYTSDTIMLIAATFTGQVVPTGQSIGVTFQESG